MDINNKKMNYLEFIYKLLKILYLISKKLIIKINIIERYNWLDFLYILVIFIFLISKIIE